MHYEGLLIGLTAFLIIGVFHPIVIKCEYYFTAKIWPIFLICGVVLLILASVIEPVFISAILAILGFTCLWSILELKEQTQRVEKGWFPRNPNRS